MGCGWTREEHQEVAHDRVHLGGLRGGAGWPGFAEVEPEAAAGARASSSSRPQRPWRRGDNTYGVYVVRRERWTHARDRMVIGASSPASFGGGAVG